MSKRVAAIAVIVFVGAAMFPSRAAAQVVSGISGAVKDATGGVLPGVTVEAASPALIERVRTVVTDANGEYKIIDLRPGVYSLTFTLPGFTSIKREGIELAGSFTATVNAEMQPGGITETLVVSGASPLVDVANVRQQNVIEESLLDSLPVGTRSVQSYGTVTAGFVVPPANRDVGGNQGEAFFYMTMHGSHGTDSLWQLDGMRFSSSEVGGSGRGINVNAGSAQEIVLQTGGTSAENELSGVVMNVIPKTGGNMFSGLFSATYTGNSLQKGNLSSDVIARGLTLQNSVKDVYDVTGALGGPLLKDRLWFYTAHRAWGHAEYTAGNHPNLTQGTPFYTPDLTQQGHSGEQNVSDNVRLTWQASPRNKLNFYVDSQNDCECPSSLAATTAPEAAQWFRFKPAILAQVTWTAPLSNRLLIEAGATLHDLHWDNFPPPGSTDPSDISILELSNSFRYNSPALSFPLNPVTGTGAHNSGQANQRFSVSYVTGSHAIKVGAFLLEGWRKTSLDENSQIDYQFRNGVPAALNQYASPLYFNDRELPDLGVYAQDQWTMKRVTLNLGLRYDYLRSYELAEQLPANRYLPARSYPQVDCVPCFRDFDPRIGVAWDVFGTGKTAVKANLGRYVEAIAMDLARLSSPVFTVVNQANRTWIDSNHNFVPDCDLTNPAANGECGKLSAPLGNPAISTHYSPDVLNGYGKRPYDWQGSVEVQQQLPRGLALAGGWYRTWFGNFTVTANQALSPSDFNNYCITAPADSRLPGGGAQQVCGLYDVTPAKFGQLNAIVAPASQFGNQSEVSDFFGVRLTARLGPGSTVGAGFDAGRTVTDNCDVVLNNPQITFAVSGVTQPRATDFCHVVIPFSATAQAKVFGTYPLPWNFLVSGTFQSLPGVPDSANQVTTNTQIAPSLGRNLAAGSAATVTIPIAAPNTFFENRSNQLDLRFSRVVHVKAVALRLDADIYNALNASPILGVIGTYGSAWLRPTQILDGRLFKFGAQMTF